MMPSTIHPRMVGEDYVIRHTDRHSKVCTITLKLKLNYEGDGDGRCNTPSVHGRPRPVWDQCDIASVADTYFYLRSGCSVVLGRDVSQLIYLELSKVRVLN